MTRINDFTLTLGQHEYVPIMLGGMGVDISVPELVLAVARLNGIAHLSDAMLPAVVDRQFHTHFVRNKRQRLQDYASSTDKTGSTFDLDELAKAIHLYVSDTMSAKTGNGGVFINVMEKLSMGNARETLKVRLTAAMDAGIDGITLSAGLHLGSLALISDHPRFRDVKLGIVVSSARALKLFLNRAAKAGRMPDYIIVEGPLAGGHLGFPLNWQDFCLQDIVLDVLHLLQQDSLDIPVIAAGGIFTGTDGVEMLQLGAAGIQVATRFTITKECGLPYHVKQALLNAKAEDIVVNTISVTGYPMRMLKQSPAIGSGMRPNCEAFGYALESGKCSYIDAYHREAEKQGKHICVTDKTCLCSQMHGYNVWTCGHYAYRLKETTNRLPDGQYQLPTAEQVFHDYQFSTNHEIERPPLEIPSQACA
ncbi:MAG TPA: nitronate monooxygenase [Armatimonadota bacterium]|nr:nitronate monooxygenase [Armatimonadota bacterium]